MSRGISKQQLEVMDELKNGAWIQVYRTGLDLRAFMSYPRGGPGNNLRITTVMALADKKLIKRTTKVYGNDWNGIWMISK